MLDEGEQIEAFLAHLTGNSPPGWRPSRVIFRNFWFFRKEEFIWHHGRLFLGGQNAAGKSTVLSMVVPILLDGNKSEERLNTFGGHGRHMAYYVTGSPTPDDNSEAAFYHPVRTSYMALEFCRVEANGSQRHVTFGQGLHHDRSSEDKTVRSWGFAITDGRRIGRRQDGLLFDLVRENGLSLSKADLKKLVGTGGEVYDTNLEYKKAVNRLIFGYKDLRDLDRLVDLLLQIRRPKLTKEVRPRDVAEILTQSLPTLDDAVMQVTAASLDHIDQAIQNIERIDEQIQAAGELEKATQAVFRRVAEVAAAHYQRERRAADTHGAALRLREEAYTQAGALREAATLELTTCREQKALLDEEMRSLQADDAFQAAENLAALRQQIHDAAEKVSAARTAGRLAGDRLRHLSSQRDQQIGQWEKERAEALELIDQGGDYAAAARWESAMAWTDSLRATWNGLQPHRPHTGLGEDVPRRAAAEGSAERLAQIARVRQQLRDRDEKHSEWKQARFAEDEAGQRRMAADLQLSRAVEAFEEGRSGAARAVWTWSEGTIALRLPPETVQAMADTVARYQPGPEKQPRDGLALGGPWKDQAVDQALRAAASLSQQAELAEDQKRTLEGQRQALGTAPPEPIRTPAQLLARAVLAQAAIPFAPLYEVLDVAEGADPETIGTVEQALSAMGLLDALVVSEDDRPMAIRVLRAQGLSERLLLTEGEAQGPAPWDGFLTTDQGHSMAGAAATVLQRVARSDGGFVWVAPDGTWQQGMLAGTAGAPAPARFIGRSARERYRLAEIARLDDEIALAEADQKRARDAAHQKSQLAAAMQSEWATLERLPALGGLLRLSVEVEQRRTQSAAEQEALRKHQEATAAARGAWDREESRLIELQLVFPAAQGLDAEGLRQLEQSTREAQNAFARLSDSARNLVTQQRSIVQMEEQIQRETTVKAEREGDADELAVYLRTLEGKAKGMQRLVESAGAQELFRRMEAIGTELNELAERLIQANRQQAVAEDALGKSAVELPNLRQEAATAEAEAAHARARLQASVGAYPTLRHHLDPSRDDEGARSVARSLLTRFDDRPSLVSDIQELETDDRATLSKTYGDHRNALRHYHPEHLPAERSVRLVRFSVDGVSLTPHGLLQHLQEQGTLLRTVLHRHEADLFERHLLQDAGREVRRCLLKGEDWVRDINDTLGDHPLRNNELVFLEWEPRRGDHEAGSHIARHMQLLRRDEASLTSAQRDTLRAAFQEEIRQIREQAKRGEWRADVFRAKLEDVLDYRSWFTFRIFVRGGVGGRQEITETVYNARSGSERSLVLLFPLLAALSVRYDGAAPDAPRLLALDEGFAGIDAVNGRQMIRFLAALQLTWVVTSEKPPALSEELSGASVYNMLRSGTVVATRPFFWDGHELVDEAWGDADDAAP